MHIADNNLIGLRVCLYAQIFNHLREMTDMLLETNHKCEKLYFSYECLWGAQPSIDLVSKKLLSFGQRQNILKYQWYWLCKYSICICRFFNCIG